MKNYLEVNYPGQRVCGIDEAGRGNWAGPMVVAGCVLNKDLPEALITKINDSKKTTPHLREEIINDIKAHSKFAYVVVDVPTIDKLGPKKAAIYGMEQVGRQLADDTDVYFVDAEHPNLPKQTASFIHGDALSLNIAAASIIAKYEKDRLMAEFCAEHPEYDVYDFQHNQGYGTKKHQEALTQYGKIIGFHRAEYKPVKETLKVFKKL